MLNQKTTDKQVITLEGKGTDTLQAQLAAWSAANNVIIRSHRVLRSIGTNHTVEVVLGETGVAGDAPKPTTGGVDYSRDALLTPFGKATLTDRYLLPGEASPQDAFYRAARAFADDEAHAQRLYNYVSKLWFMFSTPVLSNAPVRIDFATEFLENFTKARFAGAARGLPISCFLNFVPDSVDGLLGHQVENGHLSAKGGGIGGYWGAVRSAGTKTSKGSESLGVIPHLKHTDALTMAYSQGVTRRGSYAAYLDLSHPEIIEFLEIRKPTGGDVNRKCLNLHNAVNIPDAFMDIIERCMMDPEADDSWPLVDPHTGKLVEYVSAKAVWQRILEVRHQTGEPYMHFIDTTNRALPRAQREAGLRVHQSNLCSEITLPTDETRTAVCCLSSVNLQYYDEWSKDEMFIEDLVRMLDNVLQYFIEHAPDSMAKAVYSASMERSIGLGAMGFHTYLQAHHLAFEAPMATSANRRMFGFLKSRAEKATGQLAQERGACPDANGELRRNMHLLAIAPNASSSIICGGTSASIEPIVANAFTHKTDSGSWLVRNPQLEQVLVQHNANTEDIWRDILLNKGSVQHLEFLSADEKAIYKTAMELDQRWVIEHASHRQELICQAQSVNIFLPADCEISYLHQVHFRAWKAGLKTLYYLRSEAIKRADNVSVKVSKTELKAVDNVCLSCEG